MGGQHTKALADSQPTGESEVPEVPVKTFEFFVTNTIGEPGFAVAQFVRDIPKADVPQPFTCEFLASHIARQFPQLFVHVLATSGSSRRTQIHAFGEAPPTTIGFLRVTVQRPGCDIISAAVIVGNTPLPPANGIARGTLKQLVSARHDEITGAPLPAEDTSTDLATHAYFRCFRTVGFAHPMLAVGSYLDFAEVHPDCGEVAPLPAVPFEWLDIASSLVGGSVRVFFFGPWTFPGSTRCEKGTPRDRPRLVVASPASGKSTFLHFPATVDCLEGEAHNEIAFSKGNDFHDGGWINANLDVFEVFQRNLVLLAGWLGENPGRSVVFNCSGYALQWAIERRILMPEHVCIVVPPDAVHANHASHRALGGSVPSLCTWHTVGHNNYELLATAAAWGIKFQRSFSCALRQGDVCFFRLREIDAEAGVFLCHELPGRSVERAHAPPEKERKAGPSSRVENAVTWMAFSGPDNLYTLRSCQGYLLCVAPDSTLFAIPPIPGSHRPARWRKENKTFSLVEDHQPCSPPVRLFGQYCRPWMEWVPTERLHLPPPSDSRVPCVLYFAGSFAPIHLGHINAIEAARRHIESTLGPVLGGYVAPISDEVTSRGGPVGRALTPITHRVAMAELAVADRDWLMVDQFDACWPTLLFPTGEDNVLALLAARIRSSCRAPIEIRNLSKIHVVWVIGVDAFLASLDCLYPFIFPQLPRDRISICVVNNRPPDAAGMSDSLSGKPIPGDVCGIHVTSVRAEEYLCGDFSATRVRSALERKAPLSELYGVVGIRSVAEYLREVMDGLEPKETLA